MCGIAGIVADHITEHHRHALKRMTDAIQHRGPDAEGHLSFGTCALGHRRLAIVDIATGAQPMRSANGRAAVTFNGEIYGYQDIRSKFADYAFQTKSDTEVILALYQRYGTEAAQHLPGMFAFAVWDDDRQQLFCARDRFGEKPLYYATGRGGEFVFSSEIKGILASGFVEPALDSGAVVRYLRRQSVRSNQSIYSNIHLLPPAHCLTFQRCRVEVRRYWSPSVVDDQININDAVVQFRALLRSAVQRQLIADVPVGAFLSGGLDSSTICLVANEITGDLRTFSFDFEGDHSEIEYARAVAKAYRTRHVELTTDGTDLAAEVIRMQGVYDEPFADNSNIPTYLLAREARRHVKVVLTGDGGDELFGGYGWYKPLMWMETAGKVGMLSWVAARARNRLARAIGIPGDAAREARIMGLAFGRQHESVLAAHRAQLSFFEESELQALGLENDSSPAAAELSSSSGSMDDVLRFDIEDYMPADILTKIDRASMAHGLELRSPFLDVDFASFCLSLPYRLKVSTEEDKIILRRAFSGQWPESIRRRTKQGFGVPLQRWFQNPGICELERRFLQDSSAPIYDVISYGGTQKILRVKNVHQRWSLLILAVWLAQRKGDLTARQRLNQREK